MGHRLCLADHVGQRDTGQVQMERHAIQQGRRRAFVGRDPFIQGNQPEPRWQPPGQPITQQRHHPEIHHPTQTRRDRGLHPFGHGQQDDAAIRLGQQPLLLDGPASLQCRGQVEAAQQPVVSRMRWQTPERRAGRQSVAQQRQKPVPHRAGAGVDGDPAQPNRIRGKQRQRGQRVVPGRRAGHAGASVRHA